ncbi:MAG: SUF system NifU family Fe-S cluster assembly protein [Candidatus Omnitrophica bacterium]|nr:SUF system NifU family Fe-S cluster assembly protein [Candidatus Omnitrophota bacterium]
MSLTDDLYREIILEHFKNPRNHGKLERPDLTAQGANPFCGDELELTISLKEGVLQEIRAQGKGCSISQASVSMMTEAVSGKKIGEVEELAGKFKAIMLEGAPMDLPPELEDLEALEGVKKYPVRIKCAILSWNTLLEGLSAYRKGSAASSHVEGEEGSRPELSDQLTAQSASPPDKEAPKGESRQEEVRSALKQVIDPELNMNVVDLGLIYGIDIQGAQVKVTYTLTSPGCPLGPVIKGQMQGSLGKIPWVKEIEADLVWSPPWDPHTMASEETKTELGIW